MEINKVLEHLDEMFQKWGLDAKDWVLVGRHALRIKGYNLKPRPNHLNAYVDRNKLPWKPTEPDNIEVIPPPESKAGKDFADFMKKTGFVADIVLLKTDGIKSWLKTFKYTLPNNRRIRVIQISCLPTIFDKLLSMCTPELFGVGKGKRFFEVITEYTHAAADKGNYEAEKACRAVLKKYAHFEKEVKPKSIRVDAVKGVTVYPGYVTGAARLLTEKNIADLRNGEIIIAALLSPNFTPVLRKAAAIVANEGGKLSHAAILSREYKIPCVIGTKYATKIFKTGDKILVDARKGIVKKQTE